MRAGLMRHRVELDEPIVSRDDTGDEIITWVTRATVWASIRPLKGRELNSGNQILGEGDTAIGMRWSPNVDQVTPKWRARHQTTIYNIESVAHVNLGQREIELTCKSGVNRG